MGRCLQAASQLVHTPPEGSAPFAAPLAPMILASGLIFRNTWIVAGPSMMGIIMSVSTTAMSVCRPA